MELITKVFLHIPASGIQSAPMDNFFYHSHMVSDTEVAHELARQLLAWQAYAQMQATVIDGLCRIMVKNADARAKLMEDLAA